jgi:hypothetical protein
MYGAAAFCILLQVCHEYFLYPHLTIFWSLLSISHKCDKNRLTVFINLYRTLVRVEFLNNNEKVQGEL